MSTRASTECAIVSSIETGSSNPISDIQGWLVFPGEGANSFRWCRRGKDQHVQQAPSFKVSSSSGRRGPRSHSCAGISKPTFLRLRIDAGSLSFINSFSSNFCREPRILSDVRQRGGKLDDAMVKKWRPHLDRVGHAHAVRLHQDVISQIVLSDRTQDTGTGLSCAASEPASSSRILPIAPGSGRFSKAALRGFGKGSVPMNMGLLGRQQAAFEKALELVFQADLFI